MNIGQKGKPEFLKDDDEFDVNTEKGTKRPAPNKAQGYCLQYLWIFMYILNCLLYKRYDRLICI